MYDAVVRTELLDILVCPLCKGELDLQAEEERDGEVVRGRLVCRSCGERFPIEDGIPNLLPPDLRE